MPTATFLARLPSSRRLASSTALLVIATLCGLGGNGIAFALDLPVPGPIAGLLAFLVLLVGAPRLRASAGELFDDVVPWMPLLFIPAGAGILETLSRLDSGWIAILISIVAGTPCVLAAVALITAQLLGPPT